MKKIMFLYHVKEREYGIISMIEQQIKEIMPHIEIDNGRFHSSIWKTVQFMPDIIVSIPPRDANASNYLTVLKMITGAIVISMNTEGYYYFTPESIQDIIGYNKYAEELVDYFIVWGPKTKKMLGAYLLKDKKVSDIRRVKVTGYAWYETDLAIKNYKSNELYYTIQEWCAKFNMTILAITGFMLADISINDYQELGYFGNDIPLDERTLSEIDQAKESIEAEGEFRKKYIDRIIFLAEANPDKGIIVKLHPIEINKKNTCYDILTKYPNVWLIKEQIPIGLILKNVEGMIHYNSTCNLEAYIYKVPTIQLYDDSKLTSFKMVWQLKSDSTYLVDIHDLHELDKIVKSGMQFKSLRSVEKLLFELFNWKEGSDYKPVEKSAYIISHANKKQHLKFSDPKILKAINSEQGKFIKRKLVDVVWEKFGTIEMCRSANKLFKIYIYVIIGKFFQKYKFLNFRRK